MLSPWSHAIYHTKPDGNCFYEAVGKVLHYTPREVRAIVARNLDLVQASLAGEDAETIVGEINQARWADNLEIVTVVRVFSCKIIVVDIEFNKIYTFGEGQNVIILLRDKYHYDLVLMDPTTQKGFTLQTGKSWVVKHASHQISSEGRWNILGCLAAVVGLSVLNYIVVIH